MNKGTTSENMLIVGMEGTRNFEIAIDAKKSIFETMTSEYSDVSSSRKSKDWVTDGE